MGGKSQIQRKGDRARLDPIGLCFTEKEKNLLRLSLGELRSAIEKKDVKASTVIDVFGHPDTQSIFSMSGGILRRTEEGKAESSRWLPPETFQGKDVILFEGTSNLPFVLMNFGARSVTLVNSDPAVAVWQKAKVLYGACKNLKSIFSACHLPWRSATEYLNHLESFLELVAADAPFQPIRKSENYHSVSRDLLENEEVENVFDLVVAHDLFGVPGGLSSSRDFESAFRSLLRFRHSKGSLLLYPVDYAEDLTNYSGESFLPWLEQQNLKELGLEMAPMKEFQRIHLSRITWMPDVLIGAFCWLRPV